MNNNLLAIYEYLKDNPYSKQSDIIETLGLSSGTIRKYFRQLRELGILNQRGSRYYSEFYLTGTIQTAQTLPVKLVNLWWVTNKDRVRSIEKIPKDIELFPVINGFGFHGVLLADPYTGLVQCHICGEWYTFLGSHVRLAHGTSADEYREEFELGTIGLCSPEYAHRQSEHAREMGLHDLVKNPIDMTQVKAQSGPPSLRGRIISAAKNKTAEAKTKVSEGKKRNYRENPDIYRRQCELLDRIREPPEVISARMTGKPKSPEAKQKMSEYAKNRPTEHRRKLSEYAKNRSVEHKRKLAESRIYRRQEMERDILDIVYRHPGLHKSDIAALIGMSTNGIEYHLKRLEKKGKIIRKKGYVWPCTEA